MSKAVVYTGTVPVADEDGEREGEWQDDEEVTDVTIADGLTEIKTCSFYGCKGLTNLRFLKDSAIMTIGGNAFQDSGTISLQGMEDAKNISAAPPSPAARTCAPSRAWAARRWATPASPGAPYCSR
jgi:hypothetical protein